MKYPVGLEIIVLNPKDKNIYPEWVTDMDEYVGTVQTIKQCVVTSIVGECYILQDQGHKWLFHREWLVQNTPLSRVLYG